MQKRRVLFFVLVISLKVVICSTFYFTDYYYSLDDENNEIFTQTVHTNPEELGEFFEGDMKLSQEQLMDLDYGPRNGLISRQYRWPKSRGKVIVYYGFKSKHFTPEQKKIIKSALNEIENKTCIRFLSKRRDNYIQVFSGQGCFSSVGRQGGLQTISLQRNGCLRRGVIVHEFLHALGFYHMQTSHDRDKYVRIRPENIKSGMLHNFARHSNQQISYFGTSYDFDSIMHYSKKAFSKNGRDTIETINPEFRDRIGQRGSLSAGDIKRINNMYRCKSI